MANNNRQRPDLSEGVRNTIVSFLLERSNVVNGRLQPARGARVAVANIFGVHRTTVTRIWERAVNNRNDPTIAAYVAQSQKKGKSGRSFLYDWDDLASEVEKLPYHKRRTIRSVAGSLGVSPSTVFKLIAKKFLVPRAS